MDTPLYNSAGTRTKRAMRRPRNKWGHINFYYPRRDLILYWMDLFGWTEEEIIQQLSKERRYLVKEYYGIDFPF